MKKIAFVCLTFHWPPLGGAWIDEKEVMSRLCQKYDVTLIVPEFDRFFPRGKIEGEMPFKVVKIPSNVFSFNRVTLPSAIRKKLKEIKPDCVVVGESGVMRPYITFAARDYPVVQRFYSASIWCFNQNYFPFGRECGKTLLNDYFECVRCAFKMNRNRLHEFLNSTAFLPSYLEKLKECYRISRAIIVYNETIKESLNGWCDDVRVIPGGVDCIKFTPLKDIKNDNENAPLRIILPGRADDPAKGLGTLMKAVSLLGGLRDKLEVRATWCFSDPPDLGDNVKIFSWMNYEDLPGFYQDSDICVVPSLWPEPFGIAAVEAMACSKPVIASDIGGLKGIVEDGKTGFLVESGNAEKLAEKLVTFIEDAELRKKMGNEGFKRVHEKFCWESVMKEYYFKLFSDILD